MNATVSEGMLSQERYDSEQQAGMVLIPAGEFVMGSDSGGEFESPVHSIYLDAYWIDESLVTNKEFSLFVAATGYVTDAEKAGKALGYQDGKFSEIEALNWKSYAVSSRDNHPVVLVSWNDAKQYAQWAGKRLLTEAEWEKAARGSKKGLLYPWGDQQPDASLSGAGQSPAEFPPTSQVKSFPANQYGLFDMVGNVWQWCADWYGEDYYQQTSAKNPAGPLEGEHKIRRGGSWNVIQNFRLRCANRGAAAPEMAVPNMGFRCAKSVNS